ncbi:hypothetical protein N665_5931s0001 [Sinapis alba]|nr:hypothetical protein N665_5931s0001 [Sinapis alba]
MGYVLRVRMASFFAGAATASLIGLSVLYNDYKVAHQSISHQVFAIQFDFCFLISFEQVISPLILSAESFNRYKD